MLPNVNPMMRGPQADQLKQMMVLLGGLGAPQVPPQPQPQPQQQAPLLGGLNNMLGGLGLNK